MPLFGNNNRETTPKSEADRRVDDHMAGRRDRLQALTDKIEGLIRESDQLIADDRTLAQVYIADTVQPWKTAAFAAHGALKDEVLTHLTDLTEAADLVRAGETRLAVAKHGPLLRNLARLERTLAEVRKQKPQGLARVSIHQTARLARRPSVRAEEVLAHLLPDGSQTALGQVNVEDIASRLTFEGIDAQAFTTFAGGPHYVWRDPRVTSALAEEPAEATATA